MARLNHAKVDIAMEDAVRAGYDKVNGTKLDNAEVDGIRADNRTRDKNGLVEIKNVKVNIVTSIFKIPILIST